MSEKFKKQYQRAQVSTKVEVHRAASKDGDVVSADVGQYEDSAYAKINNKSQSADDSSYTFQPQSKTGGAYYLPILKEPSVVIQAVVEVWTAMASTDFSTDLEQMAAHGILYDNDKYMLARTKLCKLDDVEDLQVYLEINKLEGDGFMFADKFKKAFVEPLVQAEMVKDVVESEPMKAEEDVDDELRFMDFTADENSAVMMMQKILGDLKPGAGVAYDYKKIFESVSTLGHNASNEVNLKYFADYQQHIIPSVLEVMRLPEMTFVPTVYFGSRLIDTFVSSGLLDADLVSWSTFETLVDALKKNCLGENKETNSAQQQVVKSRQSKAIITSSLQKLSALLKKANEPCTDEMKTRIRKGLDEATEAEIAPLL